MKNSIYREETSGDRRRSNILLLRAHLISPSDGTKRTDGRTDDHQRDLSLEINDPHSHTHTHI